MKEDIFINIAFDNAFKSFFISRQDKDSLLYNSFNVIVIRILILIFGEESISKLYKEKNSVAFLNFLSKYGMSKADIALFKEDFLSYYNFEQKNELQKMIGKEINLNIVEVKDVDVNAQLVAENIAGQLEYLSKMKKIFLI